MSLMIRETQRGCVSESTSSPIRNGGFESFWAVVIRMSFGSLRAEVQFVPIDSDRRAIGGTFSVRTPWTKSILAFLEIHKADAIDGRGKLVFLWILRRIGAD